ncbi:hypothetical protein [Cupriavidus pampae]|uniref:Surface antigen domain-containing protein n=1 Tax=Cupriavidus pampae TaxID=659251 RepID=A0ABM8WB43_9BURK|nr:hypothetical protein [Cupriavidus pampae]CAG9164498.1 hypothetical protein LMG32289_00841 [Cupriavidus pampae]
MKQFVKGWAVTAVAAMTISWPAHAYFDHFLNQTIVGTLGKAGTDELVSTFGRVMSESEDGTTVPIKLPPNNAGKVTEGTITPLKTRTEAGQRCRQVQTEFRQEGRKSERWKGWYCQQPDLSWKKTMLKD